MCITEKDIEEALSKTLNKKDENGNSVLENHIERGVLRVIQSTDAKGEPLMYKMFDRFFDIKVNKMIKLLVVTLGLGFIGLITAIVGLYYQQVSSDEKQVEAIERNTKELEARREKIEAINVIKAEVINNAGGIQELKEESKNQNEKLDYLIRNTT